MMKRLFLVAAALLLAAPGLADREREVSNTATISNTVEMKLETDSNLCQATASMDYFQRGAEAQVETSIDTDECGPAEGTYIVKITVRGDGDEEPRVLDFEETWERGDDMPVESMKRYPIGDDVDLLRVKTRKLSCTCREVSDGKE